VDVLPTKIVAYLTLFLGVGIIFLFSILLLGRFLRPHAPTPQKAGTYECGEIAVGPSFLQYDLRFYVVALLFIIFEVEVALFFPPAVVFGKVNQLRSMIPPPRESLDGTGGPASRESEVFSPAGQKILQERQKILQELGVSRLSPQPPPAPGVLGDRLQEFALAIMVDLGLFFAILLVGFAYLWFRGDIAWVRARGQRQGADG
jgi:NADH-quinone oxidoreductase subunit A